MKVDFSLAKQNSVSQKNIKFSGFQHKKSDYGACEYEFNLPYDKEKYDAYIEIYSVSKKGDEYTASKAALTNTKTNSTLYPLAPEGAKIDLNRLYEIDAETPFAYRYKLIDKSGSTKPKYVIDSGLVIEEDDFKCNLVTQLASKIDKGGSMLLVLPDSFNPGWVYDKDGKPVENHAIKEAAQKATKTFSNKLGGTLAGLEKKVPELQKQGYTRIISTPIFTDDSLSAHSYWIKNAMQMSQSLGNINNYQSLQKALFKAGMNFVADGAFVNEGLEGIHFKDALKWVEKSPYYLWFRANGLQSGPLAMGVFPKNKAVINHKIVNSPYKYVQDPKTGQIAVKREANYDSKKPTYIQIFDNRLVSDAQRIDTSKLITAYENLNAKHHTDINTHNDTVIPYTFLIDPEVYNSKVNNLNEYNSSHSEKIMLGTPKAARFLTKSTSYVLEDKFEGGFEAWDANTDIAKLRFVTSAADVKDLKNKLDGKEILEELAHKNCEVQDYAISAGKYWTKKTNDILLEYVAQSLGQITDADKAKKKIDALIAAGELPAAIKDKITLATINNAINERYSSKTLDNNLSQEDLLLSGLMGLPLDSIEFGDDIVAVLGYPYITNRASEKQYLGESKFSLYKNGNPHLLPEYEEVYKKAQAMYQNQMMDFAQKIMDEVNKKLPKNSNLTQGPDAESFSKYVLPLAGQEIAKFAIIKALYPQAEVKIGKDGEITYDYPMLKSLSLEKIGVAGDNPENTADALVSKIKTGIGKISQKDEAKLINAIFQKINNTNANGFKLSEMILDRAQSGLDWRIDAAKDIADIDSIKNNHALFSETWDMVIDFWKNFTSSVHKQNPNSYLVAEITDVWSLHKEAGSTGRFKNSVEAESKFLQETGINSVANYSYFFSDLAKIFGRVFENGSGIGEFDKNKQVYEILTNGNKYLRSSQLDSLLFSYTFAGNHDKPRALHCLALDMDLFFTDLNNKGNIGQRKTAAGIIQNKSKNSYTDDEIKNINLNFDTVSNKAIAMADVVKSSLEAVINGQFKDNKEKRDSYMKPLGRAISDLAQGKYLDTTFSPNAFGAKPFDIVIDMVLTQAKEYGLKLSKDEKADLVNKTFNIMIKPAMDKLEGLMGFLVALPGNPTLFSGDELGLTGFDEKCKNLYLQNRSFVNWDLLTGENKEFITKFNDKINRTMALRSDSRLKPLNTGAPYTLALQSDVLGKRKSERWDNGVKYMEPINVTGVLRQNSDGAMVITLLNPSGIEPENNKKGLGNSHVALNGISLRVSNNETGTPGGLTIGTEFKNIDEKDKHIYKVCMYKNEYVIKKFESIKEYNEAIKNENLSNPKFRVDIKDPTLILWSKPVNSSAKPTFTGKKVLYNPQYKFVSAPYQQAQLPKLGTKFYAQSSL